MKWNVLALTHKCELDLGENALSEFIPGDTKFIKRKRKCRGKFTISDTNPRARRFFKSNAAIEFERARHLRTHPWVIHPFSDFRQRWENFMCFVYIYALLVIPFYNAFISTNPARRLYIGWITCDVIHCFLCMVDIVINCCTGYVPNFRDGVVLIPWRINIHYFWTFMIFDIISSVPVDHLACAFQVTCTACEYAISCRYLKLVRAWTLDSYVRNACEIIGISDLTTEMTWVVMKIIIGIHCVACIHMSVGWHVLVSGEHKPEDSWLAHTGTDIMDIPDLYTHAAIRASVNILCLGYGRDGPYGYEDKICVGLTSLVGAFVFIIIVGKLLKWVDIINAHTTKYEQMLQEVDTYARYKQLPHELHRRIIKFYEFCFEKCYFDENMILSTLSTHLRQEVLLHVCRRLLHNVSFFNNLPMSLLLRIMVCLRREVYLVNDVIVSAGTLGDCMYFITIGTVSIYSATGREVCHLADGAHFGEVGLLSKTHARRASVVAIECCEIYRLDRNDFQRAIAPYPDLLSRIERVADDRMEHTERLDKSYQQQMDPFRESADSKTAKRARKERQKKMIARKSVTMPSWMELKKKEKKKRKKAPKFLGLKWRPNARGDVSGDR